MWKISEGIIKTRITINTKITEKNRITKKKIVIELLNMFIRNYNNLIRFVRVWTYVS